MTPFPGHKGPLVAHAVLSVPDREPNGRQSDRLDLHSTGWGHDGLLTQAEVDYHVRKAAGVRVVMTFGSGAVTAARVIRIDFALG